jgi:hypothetical protein
VSSFRHQHRRVCQVRKLSRISLPDIPPQLDLITACRGQMLLMERDRKDTRCKESTLLVGFFAVAYSLTPLPEGARVQIDLPQDGLQVVAAGTSGRVLLRERVLGRKMSLVAIREYNISKPSHVIFSCTFCHCFAYAFRRRPSHWKSPVTSSTSS